jgi:hypothetical protein
MTYITFIIPPIGRMFLKESIISLQHQTNTDWNAILIFDGVLNQFDFKESRLTIIEIDKIESNAKKSCSGFVRNIGLKYITYYFYQKLKPILTSLLPSSRALRETTPVFP